MRWRRILLLATFVALGIGAILVVPVARDAWLVHRERQAAEPHPIAANDVQQAAILRALLTSRQMHGVPPPPPPQGYSGPPEQPRVWPLLVQESVVMHACPHEATDAEPEPCPDLNFIDRVATNFSSDDPDIREIPLKLRRELILANSVAGTTPDPEIPGLRRVSSAVAFAPLGDQLDWRRFYEVFPTAEGVLEASRAVVSPDGKQALIYAQAYCGWMCAHGALYYLRRDASGWKLIRMQGLWQS